MVVTRGPFFLTLIVAGCLVWSVSRPMAQSPITIEPGQRWALIIGIDHYENGFIRGLSGAVNDAHRLERALVEVAQFPRNQVIVLTSNDPRDAFRPRRSQILRRLAAMAPRSGNSLLVFAFSGHGIEVPGRGPFLLPEDAQFDAAGNTLLLEDSSLSLERLRDYLGATNIRHVVTLLDACRIFPFTGPAESRAADGITVLGTHTMPELASSDAGGRTSATISAADRGQRSYESKKRPEGVFAAAAAEGISGAASGDSMKGAVTVGSLVAYLERVVPARVFEERGEPQHPVSDLRGFGVRDVVLSTPGGNAPPPCATSLDLQPYVTVRPGAFQMGCVVRDSRCLTNEKPRHREMVEPFSIGETEITVAAYRRFVDANPTRGMPPAPPFNPNWNDEAQPIVNVTWEQASAFCAWVSGALPTEQQWEYAARAGRDELYQWGDDAPGPDRANFGRRGHTERSRSYPPNGFGLYEMSGNVMEWVADPVGSYESSASPPAPAEAHYRIARGGSYNSTSEGLRLSARIPLRPDARSEDLGFRCVVPPCTVSYQDKRNVAGAPPNEIARKGLASVMGR